MKGGKETLDRIVSVEVIGVSPPCKRCDATWKNLKKSSETLKSEGIELAMKKLDIVDKDVIARYGVLMSPTVVLNGTVKTMGRVPDTKEISSLIRESAR